MDENLVRIFTPVDASVCPTVGANCRRNVTADAIGMAKVRGRREGERCRWCRNRVEHMHHEGHHDVPRFGALRRDNTPTPACLFYINVNELGRNECRGSALVNRPPRRRGTPGSYSVIPGYFGNFSAELA